MSGSVTNELAAALTSLEEHARGDTQCSDPAWETAIADAILLAEERGADALAALITSLLSCRNARIREVIAIAGRVVPSTTLISTIGSVHDAGRFTDRPAEAPFPAETKDNARIGWTDASHNSIKAECQSTMRRFVAALAVLPGWLDRMWDTGLYHPKAKAAVLQALVNILEAEVQELSWGEQSHLGTNPVRNAGRRAIVIFGEWVDLQKNTVVEAMMPEQWPTPSSNELSKTFWARIRQLAIAEAWAMRPDIAVARLKERELTSKRRAIEEHLCQSGDFKNTCQGCGAPLISREENFVAVPCPGCHKRIHSLCLIVGSRCSSCDAQLVHG